MPAGDERLAQLVKAGHEQAFAVLYNRYHQRLYRYCRSMLGNDNDAQDALQSTFAGAFAALAEGRRDAPVRPWLYRIAHNESVSIMRRRKPDVQLADDHLRPAASAAEVAESRGRLELLIADLAELTERQRAALVMRELSGLSHAEIATALELDVSAAKQTIFEARRSLHEFAEGRAMVCDEVCRAISVGGGRSLRGRRVRSHLRDCRACRAFADAIPARTRDLRAIAPPLAGTAAVSILRRASASTPSHGGGAGGTVAASAGKAAGMMAAGKALAGAAAVVTVAAGAGGIVVPLVRSSPPRTAKAALSAPGAAVSSTHSGRSENGHGVRVSALAAAAPGLSSGTPHNGHRSAGLSLGSQTRSAQGVTYGAARGHQHAAGASQSAAGVSHGRGHSQGGTSATHGQGSRSARATGRSSARGTARSTGKANGKSTGNSTANPAGNANGKSHSTPTVRTSGGSGSHAPVGQSSSSAGGKSLGTTNKSPLAGLTPSGSQAQSSKSSATVHAPAAGNSRS
jgi:RNA polymerase sigma factor (sigma-70 family)